MSIARDKGKVFFKITGLRRTQSRFLLMKYIVNLLEEASN